MLSVTLACRAPLRLVKIALVAPFEGRFAAIGYEAFPAMRIALREQISAGGLGGYQVEFVAYNDNADPAQAERAARSAVMDESVVAVIGHFRLDTTLAALPIYTQAGVPIVAPEVPADQLPEHPLLFRTALPTAAFSVPESCRIDDEARAAILSALPDLQSGGVQRMYASQVAGRCFAAVAPYPHELPGAMQALSTFKDVSGGFEPAPRSLLTYDATRLVLQALGADIAANGKPTRDGVARALRRADFSGLLGRISFDSAGARTDAPVWRYRFDAAGMPQPIP